MSNEFSRRDALRVLSTGGAAILAPVSVTPALAQHVHQEVSQAKSLSGGPNYAPKFFTKHQFATMRALAELIIPADSHSGGANDAGASEFIDFLCSRNSDLGMIFSGGLLWMDDFMQKHHGTTFVDAKPEMQTALLDKIAYRETPGDEYAPGKRFFIWARNMVTDAFYTSPTGVKDIGFVGNTAMSQFSVPKEAVDYAIKHSPFANEG